MLDIMSVLDGWKYSFPYQIFGQTINTTNFVTIYDTSEQEPTGGIILATVIMNTANFNVKLSTGKTDLHEISVAGLLYGQSPSGFNVPSGLIANIYIPIAETFNNYPIPVASPANHSVSGMTLMAEDLFPFKEGIKLQIQVLQPPATVEEALVGIVDIYDKDAYIKSLRKIYGTGD